MGVSDELLECTGFEWDEGNKDKNWTSHQVTSAECEEIFFNQPLIVADDTLHSEEENRHYALGQTNAGRLLFIVFTIRNKLIRVISARDMSRKERKVYHDHET
ncbi:MAG: BrnT family toxin [Acidobacteria bacterium]|nr:BrnT family toxin [Acidobacteriota bacterium]